MEFFEPQVPITNSVLSVPRPVNKLSAFVLGVLLSSVAIFLLNIFADLSPFGFTLPLNWPLVGMQVLVSIVALSFVLIRSIGARIFIGILLLVLVPVLMILMWMGPLLFAYAVVIFIGLISGALSNQLVSQLSDKHVGTICLLLCFAVGFLAFLFTGQKQVEAWEQLQFEKFSSIDDVERWTNESLASEEDKAVYLRVNSFIESEFTDEGCYKYLSSTRQTECINSIEAKKIFFRNGSHEMIIEKSARPLDICELISDSSEKMSCISRSARDESACRAKEGSKENMFYCYDKLLRTVPYEGQNCRPDDYKCQDIVSGMQNADVSFCDRFAEVTSYRYQQCVKDNGEIACDGLTVDVQYKWCKEVFERL